MENPIVSFRAAAHLDKRKDEVMLKVLDKAIPSKNEVTGEDGAPIRVIFRAAADSPEQKAR